MKSFFANTGLSRRPAQITSELMDCEWRFVLQISLLTMLPVIGPEFGMLFSALRVAVC
jgi:hypothetical protein